MIDQGTEFGARVAIGTTPETFAQRHSVPVRVRSTRVRGR